MKISVDLYIWQRLGSLITRQEDRNLLIIFLLSLSLMLHILHVNRVCCNSSSSSRQRWDRYHCVVTLALIVYLISLWISPFLTDLPSTSSALVCLAFLNVLLFIVHFFVLISLLKTDLCIIASYVSHCNSREHDTDYEITCVTLSFCLYELWPQLWFSID